MSGQPKKLRMEEGKADTATRSPPKKSRATQTIPKKKKLKSEAEKVKEKAAKLRLGKAEITPEEVSRMTKAQKRELYAAAAARSAAHREVEQYEDDNVGAQALNEGEKTAEGAGHYTRSRYARRLKKKAHFHRKNRNLNQNFDLSILSFYRVLYIMYLPTNPHSDSF